MKTFTLLTALLLVAQLSQAQQKFSGTITNYFGDALDNVHIKIKGTQTGTLSENGNFVLQATPGDTLVFSHTGYQINEVKLGTEHELAVQLYIESLDEVLVVGVAIPRIKRSIICCWRSYCGVSITKNTPDSAPKRNMSQRKMALYPNPSPSGIFTVKSLGGMYTDISVGVFTMAGQRIMSFSVSDVDAGITVDLSGQPSGMYLIQLAAGGNEIDTLKAIRM